MPQEVSAEDRKGQWLSLFAAKTEEDLEKLEALEVTDMAQVIGAYREVVVAPEFKELERLRYLSKFNEAAALDHAEAKGLAKGRNDLAAALLGLGVSPELLEQATAKLAEMRTNLG